MLNKLKIIFLVLLITTPLISSIVSAFRYVDTYPYKNAYHCACQEDDWSFLKKQCTSYAAWKANEVGVSFKNGMKGPNGVTGWFGHAGNWDDNARHIGLNVSSTAALKSIAVWDPDTCAGCTVGHVAWVEEVHPGNKISISEYNWNWGDGNYNERYDITAVHYIHVGNNLNCGVANVEIKDRNIDKPIDCSANNSIKISPLTNVNLSSGNAKFYIQ